MRHQYADVFVKRWLELATERMERETENNDESEERGIIIGSNLLGYSRLARDPVAGKCSAYHAMLEHSY
jgi:hypothetical protein